ncbi:uncharacterized protein LOC143627062 [Bidens hawaiensis]|uniref:uncharacterized protein LOC143627062 n=1 Tax=Bidens hawaiensis TaxID=980011 RepID=UPI004049E5B3
MRSMVDPKYKEQKEALFAKIREATLAPDDQVSETIAELARKRPDLFGTPQEEFCDAVVDEIIPYSDSDEPERKRRKFDASLLDSEDEFLADNPGKPDCINVWAEQTMDLLEISVDSLSESVGSFKDKIAREIDVPANKMLLELLWMPGFFQR